jgi:hypothetical protein
MVTVQDVVDDVRQLRAAITKAGLRIDWLEMRAKQDGGTIRALEAQSIVYQNRITDLHTQNEDVRGLLHETVLWMHDTLDQMDGGLAPELRQGALDLVKRIEKEEDAHWTAD